MTYRVILRPEAEAELAEAYRWYEEQRPGLGEAFFLSVDACMASIQRNPTMHPVVHAKPSAVLLSAGSPTASTT
jgi:plasmid stabilization system protein ParE